MSDVTFMPNWTPPLGNLTLHIVTRCKPDLGPGLAGHPTTNIYKPEECPYRQETAKLNRRLRRHLLSIARSP